ncbi:MAG TPA: vanadium-dependent haloperoxidase, partial [Methylomirabilota bacterium]|nr:vanadium-dependent haloperoxidase [Methylomirabilota bacterium]
MRIDSHPPHLTLAARSFVIRCSALLTPHPSLVTLSFFSLITTLCLSPPTTRANDDPVLTWNALLLETIRAENSPPTLASRNLAILHASMYDAVNSIERTHQPYRWLLPPDGEASVDAAAVGAAHLVLVVLYPSARARFDEAYVDFLATTPAAPSRTNGLELGRLIGALTVDSRNADGATTEVPYIPSDAPGQWRRTPPDFRPPLDPHWGLVEPFCVPDVEPYVPPGPPSLDGAAYAEDLNQVKSLGDANSLMRTSEQDTIAVFWSDFSYTITPPGHWQEIAATLARNRGNTLHENARLFALVSLAQADAAIVAWESKYRYNFWRPVTAI